MAKREVHDAIVSRNIDNSLGTKLRGSVFFIAPSLFKGEYPYPAEPLFQYASADGAGFFTVPKVNDRIEVEIMVDDGTDDFSDIEIPEPRYRAMVYTDSADIAREFKKNYPFRMGFRTNSGHTLIFDDSNKNKELWLEHDFGSRIKMSKNGNISIKGRNVTTRDLKDETKDIEAAEFEELLFDFENKTIKLHDHFGNIFLLNSDGIKATDTNGNVITMDALGIKATDFSSNNITMVAAGTTITDANGNTVVMSSDGVKATESGGGELNLASGKVALGNGDELLALISDLITAVGSLTALSPVGPCAPLTAAPQWSAVSTIKGKIDVIKGTL